MSDKDKTPDEAEEAAPLEDAEGRVDQPEGDAAGDVIDAEWREAENAGADDAAAAAAGAGAAAVGMSDGPDEPPPADEPEQKRRGMGIVYIWLLLLTIGVGYLIYLTMGDPAGLRAKLGIGDAPEVKASLAASQAAEEKANALTAAQEATATALKSTEAAVKTVSEDVASLQTSSYKARADLATGLERVDAELKAAQAQIEKLKADLSIAASSDGAPSAALVATLKAAEATASANQATLKSLEGALGEAKQSFDGQLAAVSDGLKGLDGRLAALEELAQKAEGVSVAKAVLALQDLRIGIASGQPFATMLGRAQAALPDAPELRDGAWVAYADQGLPSEEALLSDMQALSVGIAQDKLKTRLNSGESWLDRAVGGVVDRVKVRRVGADVEGDGPAAVAARAEAAMADGDLDKAISEVEALPEADAPRFADWLDRAKAAQAAAKDVDAVEKAAIAAADGM